MARVSTYLNFMGNTEAAFTFYKEVFGTEFIGEIQRMGDVPSNPGMPPLSEAEQHMVMHVKLPIMGGHVLMGTDMIESMGHHLRIGNNTTLMLEPDDRAEADRLFNVLSADSTESAGMMEMFWGAYWGVCLDRFGIRWMINVDPE
jgi:PhnB protein